MGGFGGTYIAASLPSRGAWIEITNYDIVSDKLVVAPLAGSVD